MIRSLAAVLALAAGWSFTDLSLDLLRWNPRERTAAGIEILETENKQGALEAFETAARLYPGDPLLRFNAGSAHLAAGTEAATQHLEIAAETAPDELRSAANYNLGNARLNSGDPTGAIDAYEQALRLAPDHQDAKFNLELALQQQQQEQQQEQGQEQEDQSDKSDEQEDQSQEDQQPSPDQKSEEGQEQGSSPDEQNQQNQEQGDRPQQLPRFEDQPDMSADQAAAILEAVENLEREQRRKQAEQEMKKRASKGKDW